MGTHHKKFGDEQCHLPLKMPKNWWLSSFQYHHLILPSWCEFFEKCPVSLLESFCCSLLTMPTTYSTNCFSGTLSGEKCHSTTTALLCKVETRTERAGTALNNKKGMIINICLTSCDTTDIKEVDTATTTNMSPLTPPSALLLLSNSFAAANEQDKKELDSNNHISPPLPPPAHEDTIATSGCSSTAPRTRRTGRSSRQAI